MTTVASFGVYASPYYVSSISGQSWTFATAQFDPPGAVPDQLVGMEEELTDVGVDGRRYRRVNQQYTPFILNTVADASSYAAAVALKQKYELTKNAIGVLTVSMYSVTYQWRNVKVLSVVPKLSAGTLVGNGASATSLAVLFAQWSMVMMDATRPGFAQ